MHVCEHCGFEYTDYSDFEPDTFRCWKCSARSYKKGIERMREERNKLAAALLDVPRSLIPNAAAYAKAEKFLGREGKKS